jgi:hypothetical protein
MQVTDTSKEFKVDLYNLFSNIFGNIILEFFFGSKSTD